ncbi:MAG: hypothetical protein ACRBDL_03610 [Alphaproteobacteria bacterium]
MSFSLYDPGDRYRRRAAQRMTSLILFTVIISVAVGAGFWLGQMRARQNTYILQEQNRDLNEQQTTLQDEMTALRAEAQTAMVRLEQLRASYDELLSEGAMSDLVELLKQQLQKGVDPKRLESVILSARPPQNCSDAQSKRFVVITPVYSGPSSKASIGSGVVSISGKGASAQNSKGDKEAWFDPGQPVEIVFHGRNKEPQTKKGVLPLYHSMVMGDKEYRFTVTAGAKSFAKVTYDHCDYP